MHDRTPNKVKVREATLEWRLNQPRLTRVEALRQLQKTMPLSASALAELQQSNNGSSNGHGPTGK